MPPEEEEAGTSIAANLVELQQSHLAVPPTAPIPCPTAAIPAPAVAFAVPYMLCTHMVSDIYPVWQRNLLALLTRRPWITRSSGRIAIKLQRILSLRA